MLAAAKHWKWVVEGTINHSLTAVGRYMLHNKVAATSLRESGEEGGGGGEERKRKGGGGGEERENNRLLVWRPRHGCIFPIFISASVHSRF